MYNDELMNKAIMYSDGSLVIENNLQGFDVGSIGDDVIQVGDPLPNVNGTGMFDSCILPYNDYWDWHREYYPTYVYKDDSVKSAFKIAELLLKKKLIKTLTVQKFIELVNEIAKIV